MSDNKTVEERMLESSYFSSFRYGAVNFSMADAAARIWSVVM